MTPLDALGKMLLVFGGALVVLGLVLLVLGRIPLAGRLPGDIHLRWGNTTCFFPVMTGIVLSILATLVLNLALWLLRK